MNDQQVWSVETTVRLGKLTLIFFKNGDPRGSLVFEDDEEEEATTWADLTTKLNKPQPDVIDEQERVS